MIGFATYATTVAAIVIALMFYKLYQGKTWENLSVRSGIYIAKAAMLATGLQGPLLYTCLITQLYYFSIVINHRRDSKPGATFSLHIFFVFFTANQYFIRGSHRKDLSSVKFYSVCPGGIKCGDELMWILIFFENHAAQIISMMLLPLIVRARVCHAYAHTKKNSISDENYDEQDETEKNSRKSTVQATDLQTDFELNQLEEKYPVTFIGEMS